MMKGYKKIILRSYQCWS